MVNIFELHQRMTAHLFPSYANEDLSFLTIAISGEIGELANMVKKRWRDSVSLVEEIRDEIADIRVYLELIAKCFNAEGEKLNELLMLNVPEVDIDFSDERLVTLALFRDVGKLADYTLWIAAGIAPKDERAIPLLGSLRYSLEAMATIYEIEGDMLDERVQMKLEKVVKKFEARLAAS